MSKSKSARKSVFVALTLSLALGSLALPSGSASAQTRKTDSNAISSATSDKNVYEKKTRYDFDDDEVEGTFARPDDLQVLSILKSKHGSLVQARQSFLPELVKSVDSQ
jgi:hypothetical protein